MAYHTTTDNLLNSIVQKDTYKNTPVMWVNSAGTKSLESLKTALQLKPSVRFPAIPVQYDTTYVVNVAENGGSSYFSAAELIEKLDESIQSMVDAAAALYTVTITSWSAQVLDYKIQATLTADSLGAPTYNIALIAQINLYIL